MRPAMNYLVLIISSRSVCSGSKYVISGGSDEICKIFDMTKRAEHGTLMHHEVSLCST